MNIKVGDTVFSRNGRPSIVSNVDKETGKVLINNSLDSVSDHNRNGIKNDLSSEQRSAYNVMLSELKDSDKNVEIENLSKKINELKSTGADSRLVKYLNNELQFRMCRENYQPQSYSIEATELK